MISLMVLGGAQMLSLRKKRFKEELLKKREAQRQSRSAQKNRALNVSDYLSVDRIGVFLNDCSAPQVFSDLISRVPIENSLSALEAILARERIASTMVTPGIALPHARILGIENILSALAICPNGIKVKAEEPPTYLFLLFVSPIDGLKNHLRFLAGASALFQKENFLKELLQLKTSESILEKIKEMELKSHAKHSAK